MILGFFFFFSKGNPGLGKFKEYQEWDSWTAKFSGGANIPFLMLQLPQIILNSQNLLAGNNTALSAVPWLVMKMLYYIDQFVFREFGGYVTDRICF